ncbi:MAG: hypothetical protein KIT35_09325 [Piscinibacter sp.]|uniref:hypothetical protein n=1 Tax=Piscinibacter sp. TaxID=1903157 RepID=UPI002583C5D8|nr:hypothetical protein [Piscinibacter sp.]MCW5664022.1 hypothetical protein [Piscinibacter sp.]
MSDLRPTYVPNSTLGRSDADNLPFERLGKRLEQLDVLLMLMCGADADPDGTTDFERFNDEIKRAALRMAQDLAQEAHELHEQITYEKAAEIPAGSH